MRLGLSILLPAIALLACSCSAEAPKPGKTTTSDNGTAAIGGSYITPADVRRQAKGSPARQVLSFWSATQFRDLPTAYAMLSTPFRRRYAGSFTRFNARVLADAAHWSAKPRIVRTRVRGGKAVVTAVAGPVGGGAAQPTTFRLVREGPAWRIDFESYLFNRLTERPGK
jgi:hypothetical protein